MHPFVKRALQLSCLASLMLFLAHRSLFFSPSFFEHAASRIVYPFLWISGALSDQLNSWSESKDSHRRLSDKFDNLKHDYMELIDQFIALRSEHRLCKPLEIMETFSKRYATTHKTLAKILLRHIDTDEQYILVNRGIKHGVTKDMVALYQNHILGKVIEAYPWYSKVLLITDQHCNVAAYASSNSAVGIVKGFNNQSRCTFNYVSHLFTAKDNDLVISSGQGLVFPEGFCLGRICFQSLKEKALYHHIEIEPIINVKLINYCWLIDGLAVEGAQSDDSHV